MRRRTRIARVVVAALVLTVISGIGPRASESQTYEPQVERWTADLNDGHILFESSGVIECREPTVQEAELFRSAKAEVHPLPVVRLNADTGLKINLQATQQLEGFPQAKAAFLRAASRWEAIVQTQITIIIDVDFGPTFFGTAFPAGVLGQTNTQSLFNSQGYAGVRSGLIANASSPAEVSLYTALPVASVPTDVPGSTAGATATSADLRALGLLDPTATPNENLPGANTFPRIGFNSNFTFDFNPDDGITAGTFDFDAIAVHEIGHVLGFTSRVGVLENSPNDPNGIAPTVWDLFRFRPGITIGTFTTAQRVLSSGGSQLFFDGSGTTQLSTGRVTSPTGGDGFQASHWRDNTLVGEYIGIMDPAIARGERNEITASDLVALDTLGYELRQLNPSAPVITSLTSHLSGDVLTVSGNGTDQEGDANQAVIKLLDGNGNPVSQPAPVAVNFGASTFNFNFQIAGLSQLPSALGVSLQLNDAASNQSVTSVSDFSVADAGAPSIKNVNYFPEDVLMVIKGTDLVAPLQLEVNGVIVAPPLNMKIKPSTVKVKVPATAVQLNLRTGLNRVRLLRNGQFSNIFQLSR
jgi:hypothetical protein